MIPCMVVLWSEKHTQQWHENWSNDNFFYEPDLGQNNGEEYGTGLKTSRTTFQRISRARREESRAEKLIKRPTTLRGTDRKYPWCGFQWFEGAPDWLVVMYSAGKVPFLLLLLPAPNLPACSPGKICICLQKVHS